MENLNEGTENSDAQSFTTEVGGLNNPTARLFTTDSDDKQDSSTEQNDE